jgi:hypothetical protein
VQALDVVAADVNGDGKTDLLTSNYTSNTGVPVPPATPPASSRPALPGAGPSPVSRSYL